jgi:hypothetical protein
MAAWKSIALSWEQEKLREREYRDQSVYKRGS